MEVKDIAKYIDHTLLKQNTTQKDIIKLCTEAKTYGFKAVCVNPCYVSLAKKELEGSGVLVCTVIGFPFGANKTEVKAYEAKLAVEDGADHGEEHHQPQPQVEGLHKGQQPLQGAFGVFGAVEASGGAAPAHGSSHAPTSSADIWE